MSYKLGGGFGIVLLLTLVIGIIGYGAMHTVETGSSTALEMSQATIEGLEAVEAIQLYIRTENPDYAAQAQESLQRSRDLVQRLVNEEGQGALRSSLQQAQEELASVTRGFKQYQDLVQQRTSRFDALGDAALELRREAESVSDYLLPTIQSMLVQATSTAEVERLTEVLHHEAQLVENIYRVRFNVERFDSRQRDQYLQSAQTILEDDVLGGFDYLLSWAQANDINSQLLAQMEESRALVRDYQGQLQQWVAVMAELEEVYGVFRQNLQGSNEALDQAMAEVERHLNAEVTKAERIIVAGIVMAIIIGVALTLFITRMIVGPLRESLDFAADVARGNLDHTIALDQRDEVGQLASALNEMVYSLREMIGEVRQSADGVASASEQLSSSSTQMSAGMNSQAESVSQIASATLEMSQTVNETTRNLSDIQENTLEALEHSRKGGEVVQQSTREMNSIAQQVEQTSSFAHSLEEKASRVGEVIQVINDIADQTNLLALNAAIEAARAGDAGRGFAVVADEVRKLAERSSESTQEIINIVQSIQEGVGKVTHSMATVNEKARSGNELATQSDQAFREILQSMEELQQLIEQNVAAMEEMSTASDQVTGDIQSISAAAEETATASEEVGHASSDLARLAGDVREHLSFFRIGEEGSQSERLPQLEAAKGR
nr:methyl-accepting chemotaxis protein [Desulfurispira natronophila]